MSNEILLALLSFAFVTSVTPGPNNLMLMTSGANFGIRRTVPHMLGISVGFAVLACATGLGLAGLLHAWPPAMVALKVAAVGYMLALGAIAVYAPEGQLWQVGLVAGVFALVNLPTVSLWAWAGEALRSFLSNPRRLRGFNLTMAAALVASLWPVLKM